MFVRVLSTALVLFVITGVVVAGSYTGNITAVSKDEVKILVGAKKGEKGEEKTFKVSKDVKFFKVTGKDKSEDATLEDVTKALEGAKKGLKGKIETEGEGDKEMVTKISVMGGKKK
jgi:hypothetical protein